MTVGSLWRTDPRGPYTRKYSGRKFPLLNPEPSDFYIPDIVHHLSRIRRFDGAGISVAQHCVVAATMAQRFYPTARFLPAKMIIHDAAEAYYGDVSAPLKSLLPDYRTLEKNANGAVEKRFDLGFVGDPLVKEVDDRMWLTEREDLFAKTGLRLQDDYTGDLEPFPLAERQRLAYITRWKEPDLAYEDALRELLPWVTW